MQVATPNPNRVRVWIDGVERTKDAYEADDTPGAGYIRVYQGSSGHRKIVMIEGSPHVGRETLYGHVFIEISDPNPPHNLIYRTP